MHSPPLTVDVMWSGEVRINERVEALTVVDCSKGAKCKCLLKEMASFDDEYLHIVCQVTFCDRLFGVLVRKNKEKIDTQLFYGE